MPSLRTILHSPYTLWFFVIATLAALALGWLALPLKEWLAVFNRWIDGYGAWGVVLFGVGYVVAVIVLVPTTPLTVAAGLAYGAWAMPLVLGASTLGATIAFFIARYFARERVKRYLQRRKQLHVVDRVVAENSWKVVALVRLSPFLTFGLQNYLFGVTGVRSWPYVTASLVGVIPSTALCIYVGAAGGVLQRATPAGALQWTLIGAGCLVLLVVTVYTARQARQKLLAAGIGDVR
jgi:uncharacterized membrane protein YdjX (TVP38/TMEM64 family)